MAGTINGFGTKHFGKANHIENPDNKWEEFDTTLWFVLFWLPMIPLRSYRIRQKHWIFQEEDVNMGTENGGFGISQKIPYKIIDKYKLNWKQIFKTYLIVYGLIIIFFFILYIVNS